LRVAWIGAAIAGGITEAIGIAAALFPAAWLSLFGGEPAMLAYGSMYLRIVGPFYGFFGAGLALYFASQGAGRLFWPVIGATLRVLISAGLGWLAAARLGNSIGLFSALAGALVLFGTVNAAAMFGGARFARAPQARLAARPT
jgi:Na+-driven multidrug efflux pump